MVYYKGPKKNIIFVMFQIRPIEFLVAIKGIVSCSFDLVLYYEYGQLV